MADDAAAALARACVAHTIAERAAPKGVRPHWRQRPGPVIDGDAAAIERATMVAALFASADAAEGVQSFIERCQARFRR